MAAVYFSMVVTGRLKLLLNRRQTSDSIKMEIRLKSFRHSRFGDISSIVQRITLTLPGGCLTDDVPAARPCEHGYRSHNYDSVSFLRSTKNSKQKQIVQVKSIVLSSFTGLRSVLSFPIPQRLYPEYTFRRKI